MIRFLGALLCGVAIAVVVSLVLLQRVPATAGHTAMSGPAPMGFGLHIDADRHFGDAHPDEIAHHWCKVISSSISECELYDGDGPHARLVGVETIVPTAVWKTFPASEQALWHYHRTELKKIHVSLPDTPKDKQAGIIASFVETYGKIYILWDPMTTQMPQGQPSVTVLH
jgi:uncharacterized protein DUF1264